MPKNSAAQEKKVKAAVQFLQTTTGVRVPQAMIVAGFSKKDVANEIERQVIRRRYNQAQSNINDVIVGYKPSLSDLTNIDVQSPSSSSSGSTNPKPKCKQIRLTSRAKQQQRVDDIMIKKHKSEAHKAAMRLYHAEKQKPNGLSLRQVRAVILEKYDVCPSASSICRYSNEGLVNASPKKMGPVGRLSALTYKFLCNAYSSLVPINQMNALAGNNTRKNMIPILAQTFNIQTLDATELLNRVIRDTAIDINAVKLNCAEDRRVRWTTHGNLNLWFDTWQQFVVEYGFATINVNGEVIFDEKMKARIANLDETCLSLDGSNSNRGGRPTATYYDVRFPQLGKSTSKSALSTTMITGSTAAGEPLPPHFQFQTSSQSAENESIRIEMIRYMLDVRGTFGYDKEQSFPISIGLNNKGGMDDEEFFEYLQKSIMKLWPDAAPVKGRWVVLKVDSGPGRLNPDLLSFLRFHGFILYPGVPNTTAVTQETDQSYGPFQTAIRTNLQLIIDERLRIDATRSLSPWIVGLVVFGGEDPQTGLIVESAFQKGFDHAHNINAWEKVGAVPLSRKCITSPKVRRSIGDGDNEQQLVVNLITENNIIACNALTLEGYNGDMMRVMLNPIECTKVITAPHTQDRIELLSNAKTHGSIFAATGGKHLTANDIFKGIALKQRKVLREKLAKEKTLRKRQEKTEGDALYILQTKGEDLMTLTSADLTTLLTWHQYPKVAGMKKAAKFVAWMEIKNRRKAPPAVERWTDGDEEKLLEAQSDTVDMAHTAIGQLEALKKKELTLAAMTMPEDEFEKLCADRKKMIVESSSLPDTAAPNPASLLIVDSTNNTNMDTLENEVQDMVEEGGI